MFTPGPRTLPKILFIVLMVLLVACTSLPVPTPAVKPASTPTDTPETIWPTCIPMLQKGYPFSAIWSPTESIVALVNGSGICLYDAVALRDLRFIEIASPTQVVFSPDGQLLASVDSNTTAIRLWDVATGRRVRTLSRADDQRFYELVFAPDSKTLASISYAVVPADQLHVQPARNDGVPQIGASVGEFRSLLGSAAADQLQTTGA